MMLKTRSILLVTIGLVSLSGHAAVATEAKSNILLIVSDDQGYADVGFHGCKDIPTPHLDRLAADGLRCTSGYATHPFCSPTRAGLMTGRYQQRFGHETNPYYDPADHREGLPTSETLLPAFLRSAGYVTGWVGKWHLGAAPEFHPLKRGFMETFGFLGGGHQYLDWKPNPNNEYQIPIQRNGQTVEVTNHLTLEFAREAVAFVTRHRDEPWFLYLAFNAPHGPLQPTPERLARFAGIPNPKRRAYAAQVSLLDDAVGDVLAALQKTGQRPRTLVFFFSDNGGPIGDTGNGSRNDPLRGGKGTVFEGGVRVPFVVSWPGKLAAGRTYDEPVSSVDVFATALACAQVRMPANKTYDSVNLLPFLTGERSGPPHAQLFWRMMDGKRATRGGDLKLVRLPQQPEELYRLSADIGETNKVSTAEPANAHRLRAALDAWDRELIAPAFPGAAARAAKASGQRAKSSKPGKD